MDYIKEIKAFYTLAELNLLSTGQIALWHALMHINNKCFWQPWFTVPNAKLQLLTGLSRQAILKNRNKLKQIGVLDFKENGTRATRYMLKSCQASCQDSLQDGCQFGCQDGCQDSCTLIKQNDTTQDNTENNIYIPAPKSPKPKSKKAKPESKRKLGEYGHVRLTGKQIEKLKADLGEETYLACVKVLDEYCQTSGKTYNDYNLTIRGWVIKRVQEDKRKEEGEKKSEQAAGANKPNEQQYGNYV